jgi:hypothetical protein
VVRAPNNTINGCVALVMLAFNHTAYNIHIEWLSCRYCGYLRGCYDGLELFIC